MHAAVLAATAAALALASGTDDRTARAREEVERQLAQELASIPAPRTTIRFAPDAGRGYSLEKARFELDGKALPVPGIEELKQATSAKTVYRGELSHGTHVLTVKLVYAGDFGLLSYMTGYKFKLSQKVTFEAQRGLDVTLDIAPTLDEKKDWKHRLGLSVSRSHEMLAEIDTNIPPPPPRPKLAMVAGADLPPPPPVEEVPPAVEEPAAAATDEPEEAEVPRKAAKAKNGKKRAGARRTGKLVAAATRLPPEPEPRDPAPAPDPKPSEPSPAAAAAAEAKPPEPTAPDQAAAAAQRPAVAEGPAAAATAAASPPAGSKPGSGLGDWRLLAGGGVLVLLGGIFVLAYRRRASAALRSIDRDA